MAAASSKRERVFGPALTTFLVVVAAVLLVASYYRYPRPDLDGCVRMLADGDLDFDERQRILRRAIGLAQADDRPRAAWIGALAAVALPDRDAYESFAPRLASAEVPAESRWLDLGDPVVGNVLEALRHARAGQLEDARREWRQVAAETRLTGNRLAAELAARALQ